MGPLADSNKPVEPTSKPAEPVSKEGPAKKGEGLKRAGKNVEQLLGSFLNPADLKTVTSVSKAHQEMGNDPKTWKKFADKQGISIHNPSNAKEEVLTFYKTVNKVLLTRFPQLETDSLKKISDPYERNKAIQEGLNKVAAPKLEIACFNLLTEAFANANRLHGFNEATFNSAIMFVEFLGNWEEGLSIVSSQNRPKQFQIILDHFLNSKMPGEEKSKILNAVLLGNIVAKNSNKMSKLDDRTEIIKLLLEAGARATPKTIVPAFELIVHNLCRAEDIENDTSLAEFYWYSTKETREKIMKDAADPQWMIADLVEELKSESALKHFTPAQYLQVAQAFQEHLLAQLKLGSSQ